MSVCVGDIYIERDRRIDIKIGREREGDIHTDRERETYREK